MKILCLPYTHTLSHISRPLTIAVELRKRGHEVVFAGNSPNDHFISELEFEVLPAYQVPPELLFTRIKNGELKFVHDDELKQMIAADRALFSQVQPDLVLSDGRFSAPISTGIDRFKHAAIVNVSSTEFRALPYIPFFDWLPGSLGQRNSLFWRGLDRLNLFLEMLVFDNAARSFKTLSHQQALPYTVTATNCLAGKDLTLLADIDTYFPSRNLPDNYHYIGPLTWNSTLPPPAWWPPKKSGDLLAYFTMGTTWMGGSFTSLYKMIRAQGITAIITTGGQTVGQNVGTLKTVDGEIYVEDFVDGDLVMKECDVVVCHGGNGTIYQALKQGKPIVGIPTIPDQDFNMRRVKALGVGERVSLQELNHSPEKLFRMVRQVACNDTYRLKAQRIQGVLDKMQPADKAANLIEEYFF